MFKRVGGIIQCSQQFAQGSLTLIHTHSHKHTPTSLLPSLLPHAQACTDKGSCAITPQNVLSCLQHWIYIQGIRNVHSSTNTADDQNVSVAQSLLSIYVVTYFGEPHFIYCFQALALDSTHVIFITYTELLIIKLKYVIFLFQQILCT